MSMSKYTHLLLDGHFSCFHFGAILNKVPSTFVYQSFLWTYIFISLEEISGCGIAKSYDRCMFNFIRNCEATFQSGCIFRKQYPRVLVPSHPCQHLILSVFLILAIFVYILNT